MHDLVRKYVQDVFARDHLSEFKKPTSRPDGYFPESRNQVVLIIRQQVGSARRTQTPGGCAIAFYHYEKADTFGPRAILENTYEHLIPKAKWWMENGAQLNNPTYGHYRAEKILDG